MKRFPHYIQLDAMDCGPSCLRGRNLNSVPKQLSLYYG